MILKLTFLLTKFYTTLICLFSDCQEVYKTGGMRYLGDYYIMIKPHRATQPFKVVCNIHDGAGKAHIATNDQTSYRHTAI